MAQGFTVERSRPDDAREMVLAGELDLAGAPKLREALVEAEAAGADVVLDVAALTFMDSSGLGVIVGSARRVQLAGHRLVLRSPGQQVADLLELSRASSVITVESPTRPPGHEVHPEP